jgi:hypothetical protein
LFHRDRRFAAFGRHETPIFGKLGHILDSLIT